jgi:hypothetical protein
MMPQTPAQMPQASQHEYQREPQAPPLTQPQAGYGYEYTDQYMEAMAQRLAPRLVTILRNQASVPSPGQRLALAIVSIALMIPLISIVTSNAILAMGLTAWLIVAGLICVTVMVVNIVFNGGIFTRR